jgi:hypothetical protein
VTLLTLPAKICINLTIPREESATDHYEQHVDQGMQRFRDEGQEIFRRGDPVGKSADGNASSFDLLPIAYKPYPKRSLESFVEDL